MARLQQKLLLEAIDKVLAEAKEPVAAKTGKKKSGAEDAAAVARRKLKTTQRRAFAESIDLQINLKNYDTSKDKRFAGNVRLPVVARPSYKVCIMADAAHEKAATDAGIDKLNVEDLKRLGKDKKKIKKMCHTYNAFLASDSLIKQIPKLLGPQMSRAGKFPTAVKPGQDLGECVNELQSTVKFQLKKVLTLGTVVGHVNMTPEELRGNIMMSLNFLVSLLKKNWQNLKSVSIKSTMGKPVRIW